MPSPRKKYGNYKTDVLRHSRYKPLPEEDKLKLLKMKKCEKRRETKHQNGGKGEIERSVLKT